MMTSTIPTPRPQVAASAPRPPLPEVLFVTRADLPLSCPRPGEALWNMHPRVYLPIDDSPDGRAVCPYCGASYQLVERMSADH